MSSFMLQRTTKVASILCTDGDFHLPKLVCVGGWTARTWKTRGGAEQFAAERWNQGPRLYVRVVELDERGIPVMEAAV